MKPSAHFPLNRPGGTIGDLLVSYSVKSYSNGEAPVVLSDKLNATDGFTTGPLFDGPETFMSEVSVIHQKRFGFGRGSNRFKKKASS